MAKAEPTEFQEGAINLIPLNLLMLSGINVRQTERGAYIDELAESIAIHGLKQNLVVVPAHFTTGEASEAQRDSAKPAPGGTGPWAGKFEVIAGGRRFQAMQLLVEQDRLPADFAAPCRLEPREQAHETSLIENIERVTMNPADEFDAYRAIVGRHSAYPAAPDPAAIETCAKRFGKTVKYVQGRLRLAALAAEILEALRTNLINLDSAKAYASVDDHDLQLKVFEAQKKSSYAPHQPSTVRYALRDKTLSSNDPLVKFVGLDAYVAAGGTVRSEMFMGTLGDQERVTNVKLVEKLAKEKAEPLVGPMAKKDGFKSGLLASGVGHSARWPKAPEGMDRYYGGYGATPPTKAQLKKCVAIYGIDTDGVGIVKLGHYRPTPVREQQPSRDWEAERAARQREDRIERRAAQMAVYDLGRFAGTPFEGRSFWPNYSTLPVCADEKDESHTFVSILIRVPTATIDGHKAEAERLIDEEAAAKAADVATEDEPDEEPASDGVEAEAEEQGA